MSSWLILLCRFSNQDIKTLVSSLAYTRSGVCNVRLSVSPGLQHISMGFRGGRRPFHQTQSEACCDERTMTNTKHSRNLVVFSSHHSELPKPSLICEPIRERLAGTEQTGSERDPFQQAREHPLSLPLKSSVSEAAVSFLLKQREAILGQAGLVAVALSRHLPAQRVLPIDRNAYPKNKGRRIPHLSASCGNCAARRAPMTGCHIPGFLVACDGHLACA